MFSHIMIGSNDIARSKKFYDALFAAMGAQPGTEDARGRLAYAHNGGRFMVSKPIDGKPDLDKLIRATWDPLCQLCARLQNGRGAWLIEDDSRFTKIKDVEEVRAIDGRTGAEITVWQVNSEGSDG